MLVVGMAGGIASGKSLVTRCFQHFGATVLDGDQIGHEVNHLVQLEPALQRILGGLVQPLDLWGSGW